MLQTRTRVLDGTRKARCQSWHPGLFSGANTDQEIERPVRLTPEFLVVPESGQEPGSVGKCQ